MANKRMFSKEITESDRFVDMPLSSQALYFHLWMGADDDGFVSPQRVLRTINANKNDLDILLWKWFCIIFDDWVIVITHWKRNNDLKNDRYKKTIYQDNLLKLTLKDGCYAMSPKCIQNVSKMDTQYSIDKYSIDKNIEDWASSISLNSNNTNEDNTHWQSNQEIKPIAEEERNGLGGSHWNNYINLFLEEVKNLYEVCWVPYSSKDERKYANQWVRDGKIAKTKQEALDKLWITRQEYVRKILLQAKNIKFWNYIAKVTTLYGLRENKESIEAIFRKENPWHCFTFKEAYDKAMITTTRDEASKIILWFVNENWGVNNYMEQYIDFKNSYNNKVFNS